MIICANIARFACRCRETKYDDSRRRQPTLQDFFRILPRRVPPTSTRSRVDVEPRRTPLPLPATGHVGAGTRLAQLASRSIAFPALDDGRLKPLADRLLAARAHASTARQEANATRRHSRHVTTAPAVDCTNEVSLMPEASAAADRLAGPVSRLHRRGDVVREFPGRLCGRAGGLQASQHVLQLRRHDHASVLLRGRTSPFA